MSAHTPGPWMFVGPLPMVGGGRAFSVETVIPEGGMAVALVTANGDDEPQSRIDAALIAAAPDLLAALVDLMECDLEVTGPDAAECAKSARAAIAKARGGR